MREKPVFWAPRTCPIDLFGPLANRTVLERLHVDVFASVLPAASSTAARVDSPEHSLQSRSPAIAAVNRRHRFDRAVTHLLARGAPGAYSAYRHQLCARRPSSSSAHGCSNKFVGTRNTRCGRVLTALKAAATAATRTRHTRAVLSERRENRRAQHAGRRNTTRKQSRVHQNANNAAAARDERTSIGNLSDVK